MHWSDSFRPVTPVLAEMTDGALAPSLPFKLHTFMAV